MLKKNKSWTHSGSMDQLFASFPLQNGRTDSMDVVHLLNNSFSSLGLNATVPSPLHSSKKDAAAGSSASGDSGLLATYGDDYTVSANGLLSSHPPAPIFFPHPPPPPPPTPSTHPTFSQANTGLIPPVIQPIIHPQLETRSVVSTTGISSFKNIVNTAKEFVPRSRSKGNEKTTSKNEEIFSPSAKISAKRRTSTTPTFQDLSVVHAAEFVPRSASAVSTPLFGSGSGSGSSVEHVESSFHELDISSASSTSEFAFLNSINGSDQSSDSVTTYQKNVNGTVYFYTNPLVEALSTSGGSSVADATELTISPVIDDVTEASTTSTLVTDGVEGDESLFFVPDHLAPEIVLLQSAAGQLYPQVPEKVGEHYVNWEPLEGAPALMSNVFNGYLTSTYKSVHAKSNVTYFMRRVHDVTLPSSKCNALINNWKKISHTNLVLLKEMICTRDFGDNSIVFVYEYYPNAETLLSKHFGEQLSDGLSDASFSADPNAPRPYSHTKNALLRQQHSKAMLSESVLWSYAIQLTGAVRVVHGAGLACRCIDASKVILTNHANQTPTRVRLSGLALSDIILYDPSPNNRLQLTAHFQQEDLTNLGKLLLALACGSLIAIQRENLHTSLEVMSRTYSADVRNLIAYLLRTTQRRSILELMPMIGARFYSQIDAMQLQYDLLEAEYSKSSHYSKLLRLVIKLACINEWPDIQQLEEEPWSRVESGDRYLLTLFRNFLYRQTSDDRRPWIDIDQIVHSLTKLLDGSSEKMCLMPQNEPMVVTSYDEIKSCFERTFQQLADCSAFVTAGENSVSPSNAFTNHDSPT